jgi:hypothetical protein
MLSRLLRILEWAGHGSNAWTVLGWIGWTTPAVGFAAAALTFFSSAVEGWSPTAVWLASLGAGASAALFALAVVLIVAHFRRDQTLERSAASKTSDLALLENPERIKARPPYLKLKSLFDPTAGV